MVTRYEDRPVQRSEGFKGGAGYIINRVILPADGMYGKGRLFNAGRLEKGCEIGWHVHEGDGVAGGFHYRGIVGETVLVILLVSAL